MNNPIMKRRLPNIPALLILLLTTITSYPLASGAQPSAKSSIDKMIAAIKKQPSLEFVFTVWNNGNSMSGSMSMAGKCFHLSTPEMKVWYDGKTQWSFAPSAGEVNVTEPTTAELAQTNPLSIMTGLDKNFTFRRLKAPAGKEKIELTPKKGTADFASATVTLNTANSLPSEISVKDRRGMSTTVKISGIRGGKTKPIASFRFNPKAYPGVEVVDLR